MPIISETWLAVSNQRGRHLGLLRSGIARRTVIAPMQALHTHFTFLC
jgi:hypothetical protein